MGTFEIDLARIIQKVRKIKQIKNSKMPAADEETPMEEVKQSFLKKGGKTTIKNADMTEEMQQFVIDVAIRAIEKFSLEKDIAAYIKKECDKQFGATWHCIVGRNYGSYVTHETKNFLYFYINVVAVLIFKAG